jgi:hypothetical protein
MLSRHSPWGTEENYENATKYRRSAGWKLSPRPPECEAGLLALDHDVRRNLFPMFVAGIRKADPEQKINRLLILFNLLVLMRWGQNMCPFNWASNGPLVYLPGDHHHHHRHYNSVMVLDSLKSGLLSRLLLGFVTILSGNTWMNMVQR